MTKKYFMQETGKELKFGDMIELNLTKDLPNGHVKHLHFECKFIPDLIPLLLEEGIIEEKEFEEKNPKDSINTFCGAAELDIIQQLLDLTTELNNRLNAQEKSISDIYYKLKNIHTDFNARPTKKK